MEKKYTLLIIGLTIILLGGIVAFGIWRAGNVPDYTPLAQCMKDAGAKFYGAFWCPHCQATKKLFGKGASALPYIECSAPNTQDQLPICNEAGIKGYPTWVFADGSRLTGEQTLETLAERTNCPITQAVQSTS
jgi:hypothetical protein